MRDELGDIIKELYESPESSRAVNRHGPLILRLDGRAFSSFTRGMEKPVDGRLSDAMIATASHLVEHFKAHIGYTQSDEITLVFVNESELSEYPFAGKYQKLCSVAAGLASVKFALAFPDHAHKLPHFDCRAFGVPNMETAYDVLRWREKDARRNAVLSLGQRIIGKKKIIGMATRDVAQKLRAEYGETPEQYGDHFARGTYLQRITRERQLTPEQLERIPAAHRPAPDAKFLRSAVEVVPAPLPSGDAG